MIWFDRHSARDLTATLELRVRVVRRRQGLALALEIEDGRLRVRPGAPADPGATVRIGAGGLLRLGVGSVAWPQLLSTGRLELSRDPFLALRVPSLFRLPAGPHVRLSHNRGSRGRIVKT